MRLRDLLAALGLAVSLAGCGHYGASGPDDLGLEARVLAQPLPVAMDIAPSADPRLAALQMKARRNEILNKWIIKSDFLCSDYQLQLSRAIRDSRLGTDILATLLSGTAAFVSPSVGQKLAGGATMALALGGDIQSDLFLQQAGDVMATAIQTVRSRERAKLAAKMTAEYAVYTLDEGLVDVQRYDRETCNLNVALNEIRALLNLAGPSVPTANNPILPLPGTAPSPPGAGPQTTGAAPAPAASALTIIPPTTTQTPSGAVVLTPGKVISTPLMAPPIPAPPVRGR